MDDEGFARELDRAMQEVADQDWERHMEQQVGPQERAKKSEIKGPTEVAVERMAKKPENKNVMGPGGRRQSGSSSRRRRHTKRKHFRRATRKHNKK